jgi:glycolate oxidase FAD binding subunit
MSGDLPSVRSEPEVPGMVAPATMEELCEVVRESPRVIAVGGGSKPGLLPSGADVARIRLDRLAGISEYDPAEFTFTAAAGTPLREIERMLAEHGQHLPFDPPFASAGATLGGAVAAGISGSGRYRYGGIRDFLIGIRFVTGRGEVVRGGGRVVKNAAGFDLPKLMVGSLGRLGILTEVTFKVFPAPAATVALRADFPELEAALASLIELTMSPLDLDALDLVPVESGATLRVRIGGVAEILPARVERLAGFIRGRHPQATIAVHGEEPPGHWEEMETMAWRPAGVLARVPVTPGRVRALDAALAERGAVRRYTGGCTALWLGWPGTADELDGLLRGWELPALCLSGGSRPWIGRMRGGGFLRRVAMTLDPQQKFGALAELTD